MRLDLRQEWRRLQSVDAIVIELQEDHVTGTTRATVESALGRRTSCTQSTPALALRSCAYALGYVHDGHGGLIYDSTSERLVKGGTAA